MEDRSSNRYGNNQAQHPSPPGSHIIWNLLTESDTYGKGLWVEACVKQPDETKVGPAFLYRNENQTGIIKSMALATWIFQGVFQRSPWRPVLELLPLAVVSGGQVQIRWAGLAWHWKYQIKRDSKCSKAVASKTCHFKQGRFRLIGQVWLGIEKTKPSKHA